MVSGIYRIFNKVSNKSYVGSAKNFELRWDRHFKDLEAGRHSSIKLQRSYDKHGKDAFICEVLEEHPYGSTLKDLEDYYIKKLDSKNTGYNIADATFGDTLSTHPEKEKIFAKISSKLRENNSKLTKEELKEKFGSESTRKGLTWEEYYGNERAKEIGSKISESNYNRQMVGANNPFFGKTHTAEVRARISASQRGIKKPKVKISCEGTIYNSIADAIKGTGHSRKVLERRCSSELYPDYFRL